MSMQCQYNKGWIHEVNLDNKLTVENSLLFYSQYRSVAVGCVSMASYALYPLTSWETRKKTVIQ